MSWGDLSLRVALAGTLCALLLTACQETSQPPPGLDPAAEVGLVEVEPAPGDDFFVWQSAYEVEGVPVVNVGHVTAEFLESAAREGEEPEDYQCVGDAAGGASCAVDEGQPAPSGLVFGADPDIVAWSLQFVPDSTVAVRFTDQEGQTSWQFPKERLVVFADTVADDMDGNCPGCRLDAIDEGGGVIGTVDLESFSYTSS